MKMLITLTAAALLASPALAQGAGGVILTNPEFADGFANRGQCESTLAQVRNSQRKDPGTRGAGYENLSSSAFNKASLTTTRCELVNGRYVVVYYANGFPG